MSHYGGFIGESVATWQLAPWEAAQTLLALDNKLVRLNASKQRKIRLGKPNQPGSGKAMVQGYRDPSYGAVAIEAVAGAGLCQARCNVAIAAGTAGFTRP